MMQNVTKVLFVCHGNICRSPMAEFIMNHLIQQKGLSDRIAASSAATSSEEIGSDIHYGTKQQLIKHHIPFAKRAAVQVTKADYDRYDYIIVMDSNNLRNIRRIITADDKHKIHKLLSFAGDSADIADPWYTGNFDITYAQIYAGCTALLNSILQKQ